MANEKVMIVEDESIVAMDIKHRLHALGYTVPAIATTGEEALQKAKETKPDLILMDIMLKGKMDGIELAKQIRSRLEIPVVYLTAYSDADTLQRAKVTEPFGYLLKPFEEKELHTTIEMALYKHKMEKKLKESKQRFATTLKSIGDAVVAADINESIDFLNPVAEALTEWTQEEALGKNLFEIFNVHWGEPAGSKKAPELMSRLKEEAGFLSTDNVTLISRYGKETPIEVNTAPIKDEEGNMTGIVLVFRDITERKKAHDALRTSEANYRTIFNAVNDAIFVHDLETGHILDANQKASDIFGFTIDEMRLLNIDTFCSDISPYTKENISKWFRKAVQEGPQIFEWLVKDKSNQLKWVEVSLKRASIGGRDRLLAVMRDIRERKRLEKEKQASLEKFQKILEETISSLASAVEIRDLYTAGHQRRVAQLACAIAREMNLPEEKIGGIRLAAAVHDIGKILIPSEILRKPGHLNPSEMTIIKTHPQVGYDILKSTEYPWPLAQIILQHHERLDGSGYPEGLTGDNILIEAKILAVADVIEAMTSNRAYRSALSLETALNEIAINSGKLYDPDAVEACVRLFNEKNFKFV